MKVSQQVVALLATAQLAVSANTVESREYKVLLRPDAFKQSPVVNAANALLSDLMKQLGSANTISGSFKADHDRTVLFYDSPGNCTVRAAGYSLRERVDGGERKINLKFRSDDQATAANRDVSGSSKKAKTKFEADITPDGTKYSHSTKQPLSDSKNINKLKDIKDLYPTTTQFDKVSGDPLVPVGDLKIHELTFDGPTTDLGDGTAEFSTTVWYDNDSNTPSIAEISFEIAANSHGAFTTQVSDNADQIFKTMQGLDKWVDASGTTKTTWVYRHDPSFCDN